MIVVDTNMIAYLFIPGVHTANAEAVSQKDSDWVVPLLWRFEFRNVLANYLRVKKMNLATSIQIAEKAEVFFHNRQHVVPTAKILELSEQSGCSAYDCEFVALAQDLKVEFVTTDKKLFSVFKDTTISVQNFLKHDFRE